LRGRIFSSHQREQGCRFAAAELPLPIPEPPAEPLVLAEPPLAPLPLVPDELLPPMPEPEPEEAVFSFGWPVAWSRQWVAAEIEPEPEPDEPLPD
jgi:hypothetical protein